MEDVETNHTTGPFRAARKGAWSQGRWCPWWVPAAAGHPVAGFETDTLLGF